MTRKSKLNYTTRSIGLSFNLHCFVRNSNNVIASSNKKYFTRCLFVISVIVIYLVLVLDQSNIWNYSNQNLKQLKKNVLDSILAPKRSNEKRFPEYSYHHQRLMSFERFKSMQLALKNVDPSEMPQYHINTPTCFLNKSTLGPIAVDRSYISPGQVERLNLGIRSGGFYAPPHCRSRHKVAILIPFRNRTTNLSKFLRHMHPILQKQLLQYRIFVIEQYDNYKFNKGALYNIAYLETQRFGNYDCLVFHDVDLLPLDERILYSCTRKPAHMCPALECWGYQNLYTEAFGGVTSMSRQTYIKVNGYSNEYWNWGAEDDDMFIRIHESRLAIWRYNMTIARYACLPHPKNIFNTERYKKLSTAKKRFRTEGLKSLQYKLIAIINRKLFTHILANVNPFNYTV